MATVQREGVSVTDGAVHVTFGAGGSLPSGTTIPSPTFTGTVTASQVVGMGRVLAQWGVPVILASSGTMGDNGAVSGMTALPTTYSGGAWLYLPADAISAGSAAGFYWFVASSTTAGTVYNSTFNGASVPALGTTTAFATTGPGAFTGIATGEIVAATVTIPAGAMGPNGWLETRYLAAINTAAGNKIFRVRHSGAAGATYLAVTSSTTAVGRGIAYIQNLGVAGQQTGFGTLSTSNTPLAGAPVFGSADTTAATTLVFTLEKATATNHAIWHGAIVSVVYGA